LKEQVWQKSGKTQDLKKKKEENFVDSGGEGKKHLQL
jgi:hypothetical protein